MKKTSIQEAINKIDTLIVMWQDHSNEMDFEHTLITYKSELESLLEKEKQDLIDACQTGINKALDYSFEPQEYYNKTFKQ